jgi:hypothetical protein
MPKSRPPYSPEFRQQMVDLVRAGRTPEAPSARSDLLGMAFPPVARRAVESSRPALAECLGHVLMINEAHLRRVLREYFAYTHESRPHPSLGGNAPRLREIEPSIQGRIVAEPQVGSLAGLSIHRPIAGRSAETASGRDDLVDRHRISRFSYAGSCAVLRRLLFDESFVYLAAPARRTNDLRRG